MIENWDRIQDVFLQALDLPPDVRARFLNEACGDDSGVRHEVESLLANDASSEQCIATAVVATAQSLVESVTLPAGTTFEGYKIDRLIGSGGMGEVYRAHDSRLARDVAIKVLPRFVMSHPDRVQRFEQEARAAAALNHPNILAIYQMGIHEGAPYLVSELLDGCTLREPITQGSMPARLAVGYGIQIASGLAAAHDKGVVHRDLKPENLFVTRPGRVKILDFGLAKLTSPQPEFGSDPAITEHGLVLGTVRYMSPEQLRGENVDGRSDIFAFGTVLYEMLTGRGPFQRATSAETIAAILNEEPPDISQLDISAALQRIVRRCLEKNREQRFQSASDLAFALEALSDSAIPRASATKSDSEQEVEASSLAAATKAKPRARVAVLVAAICAAVLAIAYEFRPAMPAPQVNRIEQITKSGAAWRWDPMFTDGPRVYYYYSTGLLAPDAQLRQVLLNGNEETPVAIPAGQFHVYGLSPDDTEFVAIATEGESTVWRIPVAGGSPRRVGNLVADDIAWSHDGNWFAYAKSTQLFLAKVDGTSSHLLANVPELSAQIDQIRWSPDDHLLRFTLISMGNGGTLFYPTKQALWEVGADGRNLRKLRFNWAGNEMECCGEWTPDGLYFVFKSTREGVSNLWALDEKPDWWHRAERDPVQLTSGPFNYYEPLPSRNGKSIFAIGSQLFGELVRFDSERRDFVPYLGGRSLSQLAFSHDGRWLAYIAYPEGTLWRARSDGTEPLQLTFAPLVAGSPRWSPDDQTIAVDVLQPGQLMKDYVISAQGGNPEPLLNEPVSQARPDWMPTDGESLIYSRVYGAKDPVFYQFNRRTGQGEKIAGTDGLYEPLWSPNGRYLAAVDTAKGDALLLLDLETGKRTPIAGEARWPSWSPDSQYIYFTRYGINWIFRVRVPDGHEEKFLEMPFRVANWPFTVAPDGSLILLREHGRYDIYSLSLSFR